MGGQLLRAAKTRADWEKLCALAEEEYIQARQEDAAGKQSRWHERCNSLAGGDQRKVWRWIREGPRPTTLPTVSRTIGPHETQEEARVNEVFKWWTGLWCTPAKPDWAQMENYLKELDNLPAFNYQKTWDGARVQEVIRKTKNSAPGADGRAAAEWKDLPLSILEAVAAFYNAVEAQGKWPKRTRLALITMLPKKNTGKVDDYRPIALLPTLYRMWAKGHSDAFRGWLLDAGINRPPSETAADQQAYELAAQLALAREEG